MSTTLESLRGALANAEKQSDDCCDLFSAFLRHYYIVNGNPDKEWIVGGSYTLEEYRRYFCDGDWRVYETLTGQEFLTSEEQIWAKTHSLCCPWWRNATAEALPYIKAIETALYKCTDKEWYLFDLVGKLEDSLDE